MTAQDSLQLAGEFRNSISKSGTHESNVGDAAAVCNEASIDLHAIERIDSDRSNHVCMRDPYFSYELI